MNLPEIPAAPKIFMKYFFVPLLYLIKTKEL